MDQAGLEFIQPRIFLWVNWSGGVQILACGPQCLTGDMTCVTVELLFIHGGVPVSTWGMRQWRHAEDGSLASLIIEPKNNC